MQNASPSKSRARGNKEHHAKLILHVLREIARPASAYEIIASLKDHDHFAPQTVYRALAHLIDEGLAHKIESLNAFVACSCGKHHETPAFAVCDRCGEVAEFEEPKIVASLKSWSKRKGFSLHSTMVEVHGTCSSCRKDEPAPVDA